MAKLFKKGGIKDTLINVGVGGAANVAIDYAWDALGDTLSAVADYKNIIKVAGGALVGSMTKSKIAHAACDGVAVVGVSNLLSELIGNMGAEDGAAPASGLPQGTIGRVQLGNPYYGKRGAGRGFTVSGALSK